MPTLEHNGFVEMFRENPNLAPHFLATLFHVELPPYASVAVVESSLDQLIPVEFRADLVLELRDADGALVLAIVLEVQRDKDPDKKYSWPVYVAVVRAPRSVARRSSSWSRPTPTSPPGRRSRSISGLGFATIPAAGARPGDRARGDGPGRGGAGDGARGPLGGRARQRAERARRRPGCARRARSARPGARGGVLSDRLQCVARAHAEGAGGVDHGTADRGQGDFSPLRAAAHRRQQARRHPRGHPRGQARGPRATRCSGSSRAPGSRSPRTTARASWPCTDAATLDRWIDNVLGAKTAADVLS